MSESLAEVMTIPALRRMVDGQTFRRGEAYHADGAVRGLTALDNAIQARVRGTHLYRVRLWADDGKLAHSCSCPMGKDGYFCKHCVAVGLTWLTPERNKDKPESTSAPAVTTQDVRAYLLAQDNAALADMLLAQAQQDERLQRRLFLLATRSRAGKLDLAAIRAAIDAAVVTGGFVHYRDAYDYAAGIEETVGSLADLLDQGKAAELVELTEYALGAVERALHQVDDSDGNVGGTLQTLQDLHRRACQQARPDPVALAERLFNWEMRGEFDTFFGAAASYADVLGDQGLARYRELAEGAWAKLPALEPRQKEDWSSRRFHLTHIMETLTRQTGDVDAVVAVMSRDLSSSYKFLQIAETYLQAGKFGPALEWAERGRKTFGDQTDHRLLDFLADQYHRCKRHDEALQLIWFQFAQRPSLESYQKLKTHADRIRQWPSWRTRALDLLRQTIERERRDARKQKWGWGPAVDHSDLVRVFLWERDDEAAWHEAQIGGCADDLWLQLAARRERDHPSDVVPIYQKHNEAYREAVRLLKKIRDLMAGLKQTESFDAYLAEVRTRHKPKRNFIKLLDQSKLG